jgi:hypothetical protein
MGWSHSVFLGQSAHEYMLYSFKDRHWYNTLSPLHCLPDLIKQKQLLMSEFDSPCIAAALRMLSPDSNVLYLSSPFLTTASGPSGAANVCVHGVYIDDFFQQVLLSHVRLGRCQFALLLLCYAVYGFLVSQSKLEWPSESPKTLLGIDFDGLSGEYHLSAVRQLRLQWATILLLYTGQCTGVQLAALVGSWTWPCLLNRLTLSVFKYVYSFISVAHRRPLFLWPCVCRELLEILQLVPLLTANTRRQCFYKHVASDASQAGAAVMAQLLSGSTLVNISPLLVTPPHLHILPSTLPTPIHDGDTSTVGMQPDCYGERECTWQSAVLSIVQSHCVTNIQARNDTAGALLPSSIASSTLRHGVDPQVLLHPLASLQAYENLLVQHVVSGAWKCVDRYRWQYINEHINVLELRALQSAVQWVMSHRLGLNCRLVAWVDSAVVHYIVRKGRTSAYPLSSVLRRLSALSLAANMAILSNWIPTHLNPADFDSRVYTATVQQSMPAVPTAETAIFGHTYYFPSSQQNFAIGTSPLPISFRQVISQSSFYHQLGARPPDRLDL